MQALIDIIAGFVAILAAAALSLFGVDMNAPEKSAPEIHRIRDCGDATATPLLASTGKTTRDC